MGLSLYDINAEYKQVLLDLESIDDLDSQVIQDTLEPFKDDLDNKCLSVAAFIKNLQAESNAVREAEDRLKARRVALDNKISGLKGYLSAHLPHKLSDSQTVISPIKGRERVVLDGFDLPDEYVKVERKPILSAVKKWLKDDPQVAGRYAKLEVGEPSITIK